MKDTSHPIPQNTVLKRTPSGQDILLKCVQKVLRFTWVQLCRASNLPVAKLAVGFKEEFQHLLAVLVEPITRFIRLRKLLRQKRKLTALVIQLELERDNLSILVTQRALHLVDLRKQAIDLEQQRRDLRLSQGELGVLNMTGSNIADPVPNIIKANDLALAQQGLGRSVDGEKEGSSHE